MVGKLTLCRLTYNDVKYNRIQKNIKWGMREDMNYEKHIATALIWHIFSFVYMYSVQIYAIQSKSLQVGWWPYIKDYKIDGKKEYK